MTDVESFRAELAEFLERELPGLARRAAAAHR